MKGQERKKLSPPAPRRPWYITTRLRAACGSGRPYPRSTGRWRCSGLAGSWSATGARSGTASGGGGSWTARGAYGGAAYRGTTYYGGTAYPYGAAAAGAAVGAAATTSAYAADPPPYYRPPCGYYPYPACQ